MISFSSPVRFAVAVFDSSVDDALSSVPSCLPFILVVVDAGRLRRLDNDPVLCLADVETLALQLDSLAASSPVLLSPAVGQRNVAYWKDKR